jgi:hypothetical protein
MIWCGGKIDWRQRVDEIMAVQEEANTIRCKQVHHTGRAIKVQHEFWISGVLFFRTKAFSFQFSFLQAVNQGQNRNT